MIVTIQAVPSRMRSVETIRNNFKYMEVVTYVDEEYKGTLDSFSEMLKIPVDDYRLHLQDDIILADNIEEKLEEIASYMTKNNVDVVSLFSLNDGTGKDPKHGYYKYNNTIGILGVLMSANFIELMQREVVIFLDKKAKDKELGDTQEYADDMFVKWVIARNKTVSKILIPHLVQHNINMKSIVGNMRGKRKMTKKFKK